MNIRKLYEFLCASSTRIFSCHVPPSEQNHVGESILVLFGVADPWGKEYPKFEECDSICRRLDSRACPRMCETNEEYLFLDIYFYQSRLKRSITYPSKAMVDTHHTQLQQELVS